MSSILITGGAGYIGSHAVVALQGAGHDVLVLDNLCNSHAGTLDAIEQISGCRPVFIEGDVRDGALLDRVFGQYSIAAVMHFAGLKSVGESTRKPLMYYDNNVHGSVVLLEAMQRANVRTLIFSSSAAVYGEPRFLPYTEDHPRVPFNPYGHSKLVVEDVLQNLHDSEPGWRIARLRYFNPVGAHPSGLIGESPRGVPNNLMPYIAQVAAGVRPHLEIFGDDYETSDGTGVRDYIHVMDLVEGHLAALRYCMRQEQTLLTANLGAGHGYSVLEVVQAYARASGREIPYVKKSRRPGDLAAYWADSSRAAQLLGWRAVCDLDTTCRDDWHWASHQDW